MGIGRYVQSVLRRLVEANIRLPWSYLPFQSYDSGESIRVVSKEVTVVQNLRSLHLAPYLLSYMKRISLHHLHCLRHSTFSGCPSSKTSGDLHCARRDPQSLRCAQNYAAVIKVRCATSQLTMCPIHLCAMARQRGNSVLTALGHSREGHRLTPIGSRPSTTNIHGFLTSR